MVRIKNRYLLVQALYPSSLPAETGAPHEAQQSLLAAPAPASAALLRLYSPTPDHVTAQALLRAIRHSVAALFGEHGAGVVAAGLAVKYWSNATSCAIVRCRREAVRIVWAACCFVTAIAPDHAGAPRDTLGRGKTTAGERQDSVDCVLRVVRVSGTIRKCEEEAIRRARALMGRAKGLQEAERNGVDVRSAAGLKYGGAEELGRDDGLEDTNTAGALASIDDDQSAQDSDSA